MSRLHFRTAAAFSIAALLPPILRPVSLLRDAVTENAAAGYHLHFPLAHLVLTPYCDLADLLTVISLHELEAMLVTLLVLGLVFFRRWGSKFKFILLLILFLAAGVFVPRPMTRLVADDPDALIIDFHSHTSFSHDGFPWFTPEHNIRWHRALGFDAGFITDHNLLQGAQLGMLQTNDEWPHTHYAALPGEEVSLWRTHLGVLGNSSPVDNMPYDSDPAKIPEFIEAMHQDHNLVVAHLPEYWLKHWKQDNMDFLLWAVDGFEIVNSVPYCLDFPLRKRREIIAHCRQQNLFLTSATDNHGIGYATAAWSVMSLPGWRRMTPERLQQAVLLALKSKGFEAVQVIERRRAAPETTGQLLLSPWVNFWIYWRSLTWDQSLSWIAWIWLIAIVRRNSL